MDDQKCPFCFKIFSRKDTCQRHQKICKPRVSQPPPEKRPRLETHIQPQRLHGYCCRHCGQICASRRQLHYHRNLQHGGGLQQALWTDIGDTALREVIEGNNSIILAPEIVDRGRPILYNVPTDGLREGLDTMIERIRDIYEQQTMAFKLNISLGFILRKIETGEYRYFAPNTNQTMWALPHLISSC